MNHLDAIAEVLRSVNAPMSCKDLADEAIRRGLITEYGKTLHASFSRDLNKDIAKGSSRFVKVAAGRFGLVANAKSAIQDADALSRNPSFVGEIWKGKTQLAKLIARRGGNEGAFGGILHFLGRKRPCQKGSKWRGSLDAVGIRFDAQDMVIDWSVAKNPL